MNNRSIGDVLWKDMLDATLKKIDKAEPKDTFYLCMAMGRGKIPPKLINTDIFYTLYLNASRHMSSFDLYQLS